jgi:hypothetical protein
MEFYVRPKKLGSGHDSRDSRESRVYSKGASERDDSLEWKNGSGGQPAAEFLVFTIVCRQLYTETELIPFHLNDFIHGFAMDDGSMNARVGMLMSLEVRGLLYGLLDDLTPTHRDAIWNLKVPDELMSTFEVSVKRYLHRSGLDVEPHAAPPSFHGLKRITLKSRNHNNLPEGPGYYFHDAVCGTHRYLRSINSELVYEQGGVVQALIEFQSPDDIRFRIFPSATWTGRFKLPYDTTVSKPSVYYRLGVRRNLPLEKYDDLCEHDGVCDHDGPYKDSSDEHDDTDLE